MSVKFSTRGTNTKYETDSIHTKSNQYLDTFEEVLQPSIVKLVDADLPEFYFQQIMHRATNPVNQYC